MMTTTLSNESLLKGVKQAVFATDFCFDFFSQSPLEMDEWDGWETWSGYSGVAGRMVHAA
jgi:hypothetical protein